MAHSISTSQTNPAERDFTDLMNHADDFFKIELLRQAKSWYNKALAMNIEPDMVKKRIAECDRLLAYENKVVTIIGVITAIIIISFFIFI